MKNVQVIDGANNSTYSIYQFSEQQFSLVFPGKGQDIEFIEDVVKRLGDKAVATLLKSAWKRGAVNKKKVKGIHGTLFYGLDFKRKYYPSKIDAEMIVKL